MHGEDKFSVRNAWQAWLITCDDDWFKASQSPSEIALRSMEERKEHKAAEMVKSGLESITPEEVAARAASKRKEMEVRRRNNSRSLNSEKYTAMCAGRCENAWSYHIAPAALRPSTPQPLDPSTPQPSRFQSPTDPQP
jgi:hypothetical protein